MQIYQILNLKLNLPLHRYSGHPKRLPDLTFPSPNGSIFLCWLGGAARTGLGFDKGTDGNGNAGAFSAAGGGRFTLAAATTTGAGLAPADWACLFCWCSCKVEPIRPEENLEVGEWCGPFDVLVNSGSGSTVCRIFVGST